MRAKLVPLRSQKKTALKKLNQSRYYNNTMEEAKEQKIVKYTN
jgi:hypothetical protein